MSGTQALSGLKVVDFSNVRTGAQASQFLADFGAEVIHVETPGGSPLRQEPAWPLWARGKRSITLDLKAPKDLEVAQSLCATADVVVETFRPGVADRLGLGYERLKSTNPRLVYASISGFGSHGPLAQLQGYEGVVMAKFGWFWALADMAPGGGRPAFMTTAYASYPASVLAVQGVLAALYEREESGLGQHVETTLAQAQTVYDTFNWFSRVMAAKFGGGFKQTARVMNGVPVGGLSFRLLIALTKDGRWLQFSQTVDKLFRAMMHMFELDWMFSDPKWAGLPDLDSHELRKEFWEMLLTKVQSKTVAEWRALFDQDPNVWAEVFSHGSELLDHPQMIYNRMVTEFADPELGRIRMPGPIAHMSATPAWVDRPAPRPGEHDAAVRAEAAAAPPAAVAPAPEPASKPPLDGVTVVELGTYYAGPYGATLLADLGARVIKLEQLDGDPHRNMLPFPELAGIKVLQGKQCVAVDLASDKGREIAYDVIRRADIVLQSFRAGAADRLKLDAKSLMQVNPNLIYLSAPGYGEGGPCGHRPAFAPTIGAAAGTASRNGESAIPEGPGLTLDQIRPAAIQLSASVMGGGNPDGLSAATAGAAMLLGLYARRRGTSGGQHMLTTMLSSTAHALAEVMVEYEGKPAAATCDAGLNGFNALYRLYETADNWVFLAAPSERDWKRLTGALGADGARLAADPRYASPADRLANDAALAAALGTLLKTRSAADWEADLVPQGVACVACAGAPIEQHYLDEGSPGWAQGYVTQAHHPVLDDVPRLKALISFSRSQTREGDAALVGQHTAEVLRDHGYDDARVADLAQQGAILVA
jgi:crotonobetainyl-CoA:carnitine CoA-transferase CaiB-like acyl-CoA transferase